MFITVSVRFYLGAASYFEEEHAPTVQELRRNVGLDFLFGMGHFLFLFAWALTIDSHDALIWGVTPFTAMLGPSS